MTVYMLFLCYQFLSGKHTNVEVDINQGVGVKFCKNLVDIKSLGIYVSFVFYKCILMRSENTLINSSCDKLNLFG